MFMSFRGFMLYSSLLLAFFEVVMLYSPFFSAPFFAVMLYSPLLLAFFRVVMLYSLFFFCALFLRSCFILCICLRSLGRLCFILRGFSLVFFFRYAVFAAIKPLKRFIAAKTSFAGLFA